MHNHGDGWYICHQASEQDLHSKSGIIEAHMRTEGSGGLEAGSGYLVVHNVGGDKPMTSLLLAGGDDDRGTMMQILKLLTVCPMVLSRSTQNK
jgi:hypothetical protein